MILRVVKSGNFDAFCSRLRNFQPGTKLTCAAGEVLAGCKSAPWDNSQRRTADQSVNRSRVACAVRGLD